MTHRVRVASTPMLDAAPVLWTVAEPTRLGRDLREVAAFAPALVFVEPSDDQFGLVHGGWVGELPLWPFARPAPVGLADLVGGRALEVTVAYTSAYPMVAPRVYARHPEPSTGERSQAVWHVAPDGSLCQLQSDGGWQPEASITDLLAKAAGWRVEYALMKQGLIERMSVRGIVSDDALDDLVMRAVGPTDVDSQGREDDDVSG